MPKYISKLVEIRVGKYKLELRIFDGGLGEIGSNLKQGNEDDAQYCAAIDGLESLVLAQLCAGVSVTTKRYKESLAVAIDSIQQYFSDPD